MIIRHAVVTSKDVAAQLEGSTPIAPGLWRDAAGHVHISVPELLELVDLEDTPANRHTVTELALDVLRHGAALAVIQDAEAGK